MWRVEYDSIEQLDMNDAPGPIISNGKRRRYGLKRDEGSLKMYGGLEPYISSSLTAALESALESLSYSRPSDIAYLSLHSFTLGSKPPIIRGIKLTGFEGEQVVQFEVDLDVLLGDAALVLGRWQILESVRR